MTEGSPDAYVISPLRDLRNIIQRMQDAKEVNSSVKPDREELIKFFRFYHDLRATGMESDKDMEEIVDEYLSSLPEGKDKK